MPQSPDDSDSPKGVLPAETPGFDSADLSSQDTLALTETEPATPWDKLSGVRKLAVLEALFYATDRPLSMTDLRELLSSTRQEIAPVLEALKRDMRRSERGVHLAEVAGGYAIRTHPELAPWLRPLVASRPPRLSRAALEALAIIAYRQPVTRAEVEEVRGVDSGGVVRNLLDKRLIRILGRRNDVGRPMIYGTTREFLQTFSLRDLSALPPLAEVRELMRGEEPPKVKGVPGEQGQPALPTAAPTQLEAPDASEEAVDALEEAADNTASDVQGESPDGAR